MDAAQRNFVRQRAGNRCEYCRLLQQHADFVAFHIEHIVAKQHGGTDDSANLALACSRCNRTKGPNLSRVDPTTGQMVRLFHPAEMIGTFILNFGAHVLWAYAGRSSDCWAAQDERAKTGTYSRDAHCSGSGRLTALRLTIVNRS